jgi:hypothetical protein
MADKQLSSAGVNLLREVMWSTAKALVCTEVDRFCWAFYGQSGAERVNHSDGYRDWCWDTRGGGG